MPTTKTQVSSALLFRIKWTFAFENVRKCLHPDSKRENINLVIMTIAACFHSRTNCKEGITRIHPSFLKAVFIQKQNQYKKACDLGFKSSPPHALGLWRRWRDPNWRTRAKSEKSMGESSSNGLHHLWAYYPQLLQKVSKSLRDSINNKLTTATSIATVIHRLKLFDDLRDQRNKG